MLHPLSLAVFCLSGAAYAQQLPAEPLIAPVYGTQQETHDSRIDPEAAATAPAGYLSRAEFSALQAEELLSGQLTRRTAPAPSCRGVWVTPIAAAQTSDNSLPADQTPVTITADYG